METFRDKTRAVVYAVMVHLAVFASLFVGLLWTQSARPVAMIGPAIDAEIIGPSAAPPARAPSKPNPQPPKPAEPVAEPPEPPEVKQPPPTAQRNDNKEQEKIAEIAEQKAEQAKREQEEKHRQQQILLDDEKKREEAETKERQKKLDKIHVEQLAAAKQVRLAQEKMKQLDDLQKQQSQHAPAPDVPDAQVAKTGQNGADTSLLAQYSSAITKVVTDNWNRPDTVQPGLRCSVHLIQLPGGTVMSAKTVSPCNADQITRTSIEQAITKAQPLPYRGYESVFQREITFIFKYDGN
ncbi:MAG: cell envelope integrity protein TolA [Rudaea sp.]